MTRNDPKTKSHLADDTPEKPERRIAQVDRRQSPERRANAERRCDSRLAPVKHPKTLKTWIRSLTNSRLGVDRRKRGDRRTHSDRRQQRLESILTQEEINDLLS
jgi:hypothetical protein